MQFELLLSNESRSLPSVRAFARETLGQLPLSPEHAQEIEQLIVKAVSDAIDHAYPPGEEGSIILKVNDRHGRLEIRVRDHGVPQDIEVLERQLHESDGTPPLLFGCLTAGSVDEVHWLAFGPEGKALQVIKWLHDANIAEQAEAADLPPFQQDAPVAPPQDYDVGRMLSNEAVQISQLMYRAYGNTYFNPDVYYPERIAAQNTSGALVSVVARDAAGDLAGHCALELNQAGAVGEIGRAVVDPTHRGRGLLDRMKDALVAEGTRLELAGWFGDAVSVHTFTQKSDVKHGGHLACVDLGISPETEAFRGISAQQPQRVSCLLYFHWLREPAARTVFVPKRQQEIIAAIYENLQCPVEFGRGADPQGHATLVVKFEPGAARGSVRVERVGADTVYCVRQAKRQLIERSGARVVFVDLPLTDPGTPRVVEDLERLGFGIAGVGPHFAVDGDLLRLVYVVAPLARDPIKTFEPFADRLVNYVLAEQVRVQDAL
jgi:anti-sigma regulatory factor (Ser/Thr protein kinase)